MPRSRIVLTVFAVVAVVNLVAVGIRSELGEWLTKPLLMPLLGAYLWSTATERGRRPEWVMIVGLGFATAGDVVLLRPGTGWLAFGMALFLGTHLCYLTAFGRGGRLPALRRPPLLAVPAGYAVVAAAVLVWLWPGLAATGLALPMVGYALALATMASAAAGYGWWVGLGGALFLTSDMLIAVGVAEAATLPGPPIWVMATYTAGQTLIALGWAHRRPVGTGALTPTAAPATL